ncbi:hypothetical protein JB92DRAFT_2818570 [Gautieria morchelliformis]|nr:hypothetical protein JB92DRAFT_2818570 [Gautieria morchelliformis]
MVQNSCITLYDTASRTGNPWNPMSLRARLALNFKGLPFKTVWLEYPDIEPTLRDIGAAPTFFDNPSPRKWIYTIPVIVDPGHLTPAGDPTVVPDSWAIAEYLDETYPNQNILFPPGTKALQALFIDHSIMHIILDILLPTWTPNFLPFLNDKSLPYFRQTREAFFKKKLEDVCPRGSQPWEETWDRVQKAFSEIATFLDKNSKGAAFVMGGQVTYADLVLASVLETIILVAPEEWEARVKHWDGGRWEILQRHCAGWSGMH